MGWLKSTWDKAKDYVAPVLGAAIPIGIGMTALGLDKAGVKNDAVQGASAGFQAAAPLYGLAGAAALAPAAIGALGSNGSAGFAGLNAAGANTLSGGIMSGAGGAGMASAGGIGMGGLATLGSGLLGAGASYFGSKAAGDAASDAANTAAAASDRATAASLQMQREQLAYLQDVDKLPREYREAALAKLNETYNAPGGFQYPQEEMIANAQKSPLYDAIMGGQKAGEDAILRNQAMTGGFRSGNMQSNLNEFNTGLQNSALLTAYDEQKQNYNQGLTGLGSLAGLQGQTSNISNVMGQMGQTSAAGIMNSGNIMAQGITAQGQAFQQGLQGIGNAVGSMAGNYLYAKGKGIL